MILEHNIPQEQGQSSPAESTPGTERVRSVRRTIRRLQELQQQDPQESELLLVSVLQKSIASQPCTPRRPSVIHRTPPVTPTHHLSPQEPISTPIGSSAGSDSVFNSPIRVDQADLFSDVQSNTPKSSRETTDSSSTKTFSGERKRLLLDHTSSFISRNKMAELIADLDDIDHEAEFLLRNFPAAGLDEPSLIQDYEDALIELKTLTKNFSKATRALINAKDEVVDAVVHSWPSKLMQLEGNDNVY